MQKMATCHPDKLEAALGMCDTCRRQFLHDKKYPDGKPCACGCGQLVRPRREYVKGHHMKLIPPEEFKRRGELIRGRVKSEEECRRISQSKMGHSVSEEARRKISEKNRGRVMPPEFRARLSAARLGKPNPRRLGFVVSEETRRKIGDAHRGRKRSPEVGEKLRQLFQGKPLSLEHRQKLSDAHKGYVMPESQREAIGAAHTGDKSWRWKGGKTDYPPEWKKQRRLVRKRDGLVCMLNSEHGFGRNRRPDAHHIDGDKKNCDLKNLINLCRSCHMLCEHGTVSAEQLHAILSERYGYVYP